MKLSYCILFVFCVGVSFQGLSQETPTDKKQKLNIVIWPFFQTANIVDSLKVRVPKSNWGHKNKFGADINEVAFQNWNAGGSNSISILLHADIKRTYEYRNIRWQNEFLSHYGINAQKGQKLRKTDDHLEINSTFGYRPDTLSNWFYSAKMNFRTQFDKGYNYPDRENSISSFMAPGYYFIGMGAEYGKDSDVFTLYLSPATEKTTFVMDRRLANQGAFGVRPAQYNENGILIREGSTSRSEFGILVTSEYNTKIFKNIHLATRINLYTDYLKDFGNIDVDWKVVFEFRVNNFVAAKIGSHLIYDNDTKTTKTTPEGEDVKAGAKVQWKQELGLGIVVEI